jgi:KDEL-tailed cysteine endopeptidase
MKKGFAAIAVVGVAAAVAVFAITQGSVTGGLNLSSSDAAFNKYLAKHGKSYATKEEYAYRKSLFDTQVHEMTAHNAQNDKTWFVALNKFSDMTKEEFQRTLGGGINGEERPEVSAHHDHHHVLAASPVDWRGSMNPVRDQGQCGSCWSFAAIGALEGRIAAKHGHSPALSEQQMVDCATACHGCQGGWSSKALQYVQAAGGSASRSAYPYTARQGSCQGVKGGAAATVTGVYGVSDALTAIAGGPIAVYVQAQGGFMSYGGGIYNGYCGQYDHAVTAVGWGQSGATSYWIIRNSWGTGWGESGHIRVQINGNCRITFDSFPTVV